MVTEATNQNGVVPETRGTIVEIPIKGLLYGVARDGLEPVRLGGSDVSWFVLRSWGEGVG